jgi:preprotein translocase subunit SecY
MTRIEPPSLATWLLRHLGRRNDALSGDLLEQYRRGRSAAWYWRQALTAIVVSRRREVLLTVGILGIYWMGHYLPILGANTNALASLGRQRQVTTFRFYDLFVGGNLASVTIFALGILPYVTASILAQLLGLLWRSLRHTLPPARRSMRRYTWLLAILLCIVQAYGVALFLERQTTILGGLQLVYNPGWVFRFTTVATLAAGTAALMWVSDYITDCGIGNGMFLTFIGGVLVGLPHMLSTVSALTRAGLMDSSDILAFVRQLAGSVAVVAITSHFYRRATQSVPLS